MPEVSRDRGAFARKLGTKIPGKTGHFGDHGLGRFKTGLYEKVINVKADVAAVLVPVKLSTGATVV